MAKNMTLSEMAQVIMDKAADRGIGIIDVDYSVASHDDTGGAQIVPLGNYAPCCETMLCEDCGMDCEAALGIQMAAEWEDQRGEQQYPWKN